jgi:protease-4
MNAFLRSFLASVLAIVVVAGLVVGGVLWKLEEKAKIEDGSYLVLDLYGTITEYDAPGGVLGAVLGGGGETLQRILDNLARAAVDDRIAGVILKLSSNNSLGAAKLEEIRAAVKAVQAAGKPVYGFADSCDRKTYYLAAACDSLFAPPTAYLGFTGLGLTTSHVKRSLVKLGIEPQLHKIKDYKAAAEMVTRADMSEPVRENRAWMLDERWEVFCAALAEDRGLSEGDIGELMELAVMTGLEAKERGLVDELLYWDQLDARLRREDDDVLRTVCAARYAEEPMEDLGLGGDRKVAVVHAQGMIGGRESRVDPLLGIMMGHETVCAALRRARQDEDVVAVVLRVDSGGGESLASDLIGREVEITDRVKPVVVSMVDRAASGGYMISYRARRLMADANTVTGSIGSISGKMNMAGLYEKLGITHDHLGKGPNAFWWSDHLDWTPEQRARFEENHWQDFNAWLADVARCRGLTFAEAEQLAHGRVWSGRQAAQNRLVDAVGGLREAVAAARELAGVDADAKIGVVHYPESHDLLETITGGEDDAVAAVRNAAYLELRRELSVTGDLLRAERLAVAEDWLDF